MCVLIDDKVVKQLDAINNNNLLDDMIVLSFYIRENFFLMNSKLNNIFESLGLAENVEKENVE